MLSQCISALALVLPSWKFYSLPHQFTTNGLVGVINITATRASRGNNSNAAFIRTLSEFRPCAKAMNSCFFFLFCWSSALFIPRLIHKAALSYASVICHHFPPSLYFVLGYVLKVLLKEMVCRFQKSDLKPALSAQTAVKS